MKRAIQTLDESSITYHTRIIEPLLREIKKDMCDFLPGEPIVFETDEQVNDGCQRSIEPSEFSSCHMPICFGI
jgi:hypothetical protein